MSDSTEPITFDAAAAAELEQFAYAMAAEAGAVILDTLGQKIVVSYKDEGYGDRAPTNPVSDADKAVEAMIEERIRTLFPDHSFLGEETVDSFDSAAEFTWAVDPIDGTQNFVNGIPFYSSSIGVLQNGVPIAGAVWGASTHTLHPASTTPTAAALSASTVSRSIPTAERRMDVFVVSSRSRLVTTPARRSGTTVRSVPLP